MANAVGFEQITISDQYAIGPTESMVHAKKVMAAIFYLDPASTTRIRWRSDNTDPATNIGMPLSPGAEMVLVGFGNITRAKFIAEVGTADLYAVYYDQVDVVQINLNGINYNPGGGGGNTALSLTNLLGPQSEVIALLKQIQFNTGEPIGGNQSGYGTN